MANNPAQNPVTTLRGYPLPVPGNALPDDAVRLSTALSMLDADVSAASTKLYSLRSVSASYTVSVNDLSSLVDYSGTSGTDTITLPLLSAVRKGFTVKLRNSSSVSITVGTGDSAAINTQSTYSLLPNTTIELVTDGTSWKILSLAQVSSTGTLTASGTLSLPGQAFTSDPSVGLYLVQNGQGALVATNTSALVWSASGILAGAATGGFKGGGTINALRLFYAGQDLIARNDGTANSPTYSFGSEPSLGVYRASTGVLGISALGQTQFTISSTGLVGTGATSVPIAQVAGSANLTDLYINGVSLHSSLTFGPNGLVVAGATGGTKGAGTVNATDVYAAGTSLGSLLGLNGAVGGTVNLTDLKINGNSLASAINFSSSAGVFIVGATGGAKGAGSLNVGALYFNGVAFNPGVVSPAAGTPLSFVRINSAGTGMDYRAPAQVVSDIGAQPALGYTPVNRSGDTITTLVVSGTLDVGAATTLYSTLTVQGTTSAQTVSVGQNLGVGGALTVSGASTVATLSATGVAVSGNLSVSGSTSLGSLSTTSSVRCSGTMTVVGSTTLAGLSATTGTFSGAVSVGGVMTASGGLTASSLTCNGSATCNGLFGFNGGVTVVGGGLTMGSGVAFHTSDGIGGFQFAMDSGLGAASGSQVILSRTNNNVGANNVALLSYNYRNVTGGDWTTATTRFSRFNDGAIWHWLDWNYNGFAFGVNQTNIAQLYWTGVNFSLGVTMSSTLQVSGDLTVSGYCHLQGAAFAGSINTGTIFASGTVFAPGFSNTSDARLKRDIGGVDEGLATQFVETVQPVSFRWENAALGKERRFGYLAQQVAGQGFDNLVSVAPQEGLPDALAVEYTGAIPLLHTALRRSMRRIDALMSRIADLERRLSP